MQGRQGSSVKVGQGRGLIGLLLLQGYLIGQRLLVYEGLTTAFCVIFLRGSLMPCGQLKKLSGSQCCLITLDLSRLPPKYACSWASSFKIIVGEVDEGSPLDHAVGFISPGNCLMRFSSHFSLH